MSGVRVIYSGNDMLIELADLKNVATGVYSNAATVAVTLKDSAGVNVTGQAWPLAMAYVTGSNGLYRATLPDGLGVTANAKYTAHITADAGAGLNATWDIETVCRPRT